MEVKIDTKEKFTVVTPVQPLLSDNIAAILAETCTLQQQFYEANSSFVICCLQPEVEKKLDQLELLELLNITPTESEAWDIVQMEEIERELLDGDDIEFGKND